MSDYEVSHRMRDDIGVIVFKCPNCGEQGDIDDDQYHGRISIHHAVKGCGFHETINLAKTMTEGETLS